MTKLRVANVGLVVGLVGVFVAPWWVTVTAILASMHLAWRGTNEILEEEL